MKPICTFKIIPRIPAPLERLRELAGNLAWAWNHDTIALFRRLDIDLWETSGHNPVRMLGLVDQSRLEAAAADDSFLAHLERVCRAFDSYLEARGCWFKKIHGTDDCPRIAYFSAEFGLTECLSIFAGGLGILAGDHLKSASDLGVPLVGVGLLYQQGYFRQYLNASGWQQEAYEDNDFHTLPIVLERSSGGQPLMVEVSMAGRRVFAQIWRVCVGRSPLYLLDTNVAQNSRGEERDITDQLYGGDSDMRIRQEILLGIGGFRALQALGVHPTVVHMNEGHSAFASLEMARQLMSSHRISFAEASPLARAALVFTTHTPVEAGHDYFAPPLMDKYFGSYIAELGMTRSDFLALGRRNALDEAEPFCMTILALRMAAFSNGVSRLHGQVSRKLWRGVWPEVPVPEVPIGHITNGVHYRSWISDDMNQLYDRYLGPAWREQPGEESLWRRVESIPAEELWRTHERRRERLVAFARRRLHSNLLRRGVSQADLEAAEEVLDPETLTIGFARRFATYKRATLLLRDKERLLKILSHANRPVQIIYAGKAHPRDDQGKEFIRQIATLARQPEFRRRLVFLEDYDMVMARYLVQGVDVWLNTPLRPNEASGTSGMKALANGALNLSTLDGWWDEAYRSHGRDRQPVGWAIGQGESYADRDYQDQVEAEALYDLLEGDVVPAFYDRRADGLPRRWIQLMKNSIGSLGHLFNTNRMVREYSEKIYLPAHLHFNQLLASDAARARSLASSLERIRAAWPQVQVRILESGLPAEISLGEAVRFLGAVEAGPLTPQDLQVELYLGRVDAEGEIVDAEVTPMTFIGKDALSFIYEASAAPRQGSGRFGFTIRVLPDHPDLGVSLIPGLIAWARS